MTASKQRSKTATTSQKSDTLEYKSVDLYYIYSTLCTIPSFADVERKLSVGSTIAEWSHQAPYSRQGLSPSLRIMRSLWHQGTEEPVFILDKDGEPVAEGKFAITMRLCEHGPLVTTVRLSLNVGASPLDFRLIHAALALVRRTENGLGVGLLMKCNESHPTTLYSLFTEQRNQILELLKPSGVCHMTMNSHNSTEPNLESQNPYVVTACQLELEKGRKATPWWEQYPPWSSNDKVAPQLQRRWKEIATILLRLVDGKDYLDKTHLDCVRLPSITQSPNYDLCNYAWDSRFYMAFHARSSLVLSYNLTEKPIAFMLPSLLDMVEILRTHWHATIMINALLDTHIIKIQSYDSSVPIDIVQDVLQLRKLWALHLHDPATYKFEGGSVTAIAQTARKQFWLDHLENLTVRKFAIMDRIFEDQMLTQRMSEVERFLHRKGVGSEQGK